MLDEPLSMLDTTAALDFIQALDNARQDGQGFVICEHRHEYIGLLDGLRKLDLSNFRHGQHADQMAMGQVAPAEIVEAPASLRPNASRLPCRPVI